MLATVSDALWTIGGIVFFGAMIWIVRSTDPHWCARDGRAFTCRVQPVSTSSRPSGGHDRRTEGRWRQARAIVSDDGVHIGRRGLHRSPGSLAGSHPVIGRAQGTRRRMATFVLGGEPNFVLIIPAWSKAVAVLDGLAEHAPGTRPAD